MAFRWWFGRIQWRDCSVVRCRLPGLSWLTGGVSIVIVILNKGYVMDAGRESGRWTVQLNTLGSLTSDPLEVVPCLPDAQHKPEHWIQARGVASWPKRSRRAGLRALLPPMRNPCCSVANLSGQPLISVGSTGSVDAYYDWVWFV